MKVKFNNDHWSFFYQLHIGEYFEWEMESKTILYKLNNSSAMRILDSHIEGPISLHNDATVRRVVIQSMEVKYQP